MKSTKLAILYGLLVWAIPFVIAIFIFPTRESNRPLFESIMPVSVVFATVLFSVLYSKKVGIGSPKEGLLLGLTWVLISLAIDALMFSKGPMKMTLRGYVDDIGIAYLMIPIITKGFGYPKR
ncbi:MAG: hypothetical protein UX19_C0003G0028 [Candidatus Woesebacteria bacterium GW2011_GWA1_45_8]|uniref:Uncharacterized protein n=1 Tax=Candidatus Woesebacteria bacterium GW2011_GWA1_45_8 TaxID=1618559 RepID=A0A0G1Q3K2_9BACT|nr:MAG: hypothetical protein UX19_C0003G0028 [Candidatus Woesebacteria bacterium GW2011_GWA1_45_8]